MRIKPSWVNKKINFSDTIKVKQLLRKLHLNTVCEQARCPNLSECFAKKTATFLILGKVCTRNCRFCNITNDRPQKVNSQEPYLICQAIRELGLNYVVITSPTRDDLPDGGAGHFVKTVSLLRRNFKNLNIELLIPDFRHNEKALEKVVFSSPEVIGHNLETVPRLYPLLRPQADYRASLDLLKKIKIFRKKQLTKSALILGLGEKIEEVKGVLADLRKAECDFLALGQYLQPSLKHAPVKKYLKEEEFYFWQEYAKNLGFKSVSASIYTRSSYQAHQLFVESR